MTAAPPPSTASRPDRAASALAGSRRFGPPLTARSLRDMQARRGGPPSRYDAASLCRLLRDSIDPAYVMIDRSMPRYDIAPAQCEALWAYLAGEAP